MFKNIFCGNDSVEGDLNKQPIPIFYCYRIVSKYNILSLYLYVITAK